MSIKTVGPEELKNIQALNLKIPEKIPEIPYTPEELKSKENDYILVFGTSVFNDGTPVTIRNLKKRFGKDPAISEPCFYNQDWYDKEHFIDIPMEDGWFFIRKNVYEDSRAVQPAELMKAHAFPSAITCTYAFFAAWYVCGIRLWEHDFVWCRDTDHNGDRIYVGKYHDIDGVNKNGFSIHRHLALRPCYGCID